MFKKISASFYNPQDKIPPIFFRQTLEGKGTLQNMSY